MHAEASLYLSLSRVRAARQSLPAPPPLRTHISSIAVYAAAGADSASSAAASASFACMSSMAKGEAGDPGTLL